TSPCRFLASLHSCPLPSSLLPAPSSPSLSFFFNDPPPTEIYPLSLHDALPISTARRGPGPRPLAQAGHSAVPGCRQGDHDPQTRSEEHTSELQSLTNLVCRLLLEKKKKKQQTLLLHKQPKSITIHDPPVHLTHQ